MSVNMRLHSYTVARDFGFAPNPFYGVCTLATCKPEIRKSARIGDWVAGIGSKTAGFEGKIVYAMKVTEKMTFDKYWRDQRFQRKKPYFYGSVKQAYGDNIYHREKNNDTWIQEDSHHSFPNGLLNQHNLDRDTKTDKILISNDFYYWGNNAIEVPEKFRDWQGRDIYRGRGHQNTFPVDMVEAFEIWCRSHEQQGVLGLPHHMLKHHNIKPVS